MKSTLVMLLAAILTVVYTLEAAPTLAASAALEHLKNGALLIDVRTTEEFQAKHLTNAVNIPLSELKETLPRRVPDKGKVLLLHCRTGHRSGIAEQQLRTLGYTNAFSIGSYEQAQQIVGGLSPSKPGQ